MSSKETVMEQRNAIARTIHTAVKVAGIADVYSLASTRDVYERRVQADAVIAHLWSEAMKPDVTEALQRKLANGNDHIYGLFEGDAVELVETILTALLGPNPNEQ